MCQEPLEEVMAAVDFPVYGLPEEVFGLRYSRYSSSRPYPSNQRVALVYQSERHIPFLHERLHKNVTFSVSSSRVHRCGRPIHSIGGYTLREDGSQLFVFYGSLTIDGEQFMGNFTSYLAPAFDTSYGLFKGRMVLQGGACGLHPDELIQVLQSLRVLNGKAVKSSC